MIPAFKNFKEIDKLPTLEEKQRRWLEDYEGKGSSIALKGKHQTKWQTEPLIYSDDKFSIRINCIKELKNRTRIEFDDKDSSDEKDLKKIGENIEKTIKRLKEKNIGFIRSTHHGASDYLWIEFNRDLKEKEKKAFLLWISPEDSEVDLNFASSRKVFPVLFARHWKHSYYQEIPVEYFEGEKVNFDGLEIEVDKGRVSILKKKTRSFEYITGIKRASQIFKLGEQTKKFEEIQPLFYDRSGLFWLWNEKLYWEIVDEIDLLNMIEEATGKDVITSKNRTELINSLKQLGRKRIPKPIKSTWIQFQNKIYDSKTGESFTASPEYFVTNPIPYKISGISLTPNIDRIFEEWVGKDYVQTLHEIISYCLLPDYPLHRIFCLIGSGLNGKSKFLELLRKFIGKDNCCSTELDTLISSRFEITRLHKKLVAQLGETNFNEISKTSILKKLSGGDLIGFEYKNKNPFEEINYAKIIIATNNLPTTTDKTIGFYRRWLIIDFPTQFTEKKDILSEIPEEEYSNLATRCLITLNELLKKREFHKEGTIEEKKERYEARSNFLETFINLFTEQGINEYITKADFFKKFSSWSKENKHRELSDSSVGMKMKKIGIDSEKKYFNWLFDGKGGQMRVWVGIKWKD